MYGLGLERALGPFFVSDGRVRRTAPNPNDADASASVRCSEHHRDRFAIKLLE
jgi:hypothetical protein